MRPLAQYGAGERPSDPGKAPGLRSFAPEENPFETVVADVTHRCNMACANCYVPNRNVPDMDIARLEACLTALPKRVNLRLIGAEPTMRRDLPEIVAMVRRRGHRPVLLTNGLRLARDSYVRTLRDDRWRVRGHRWSIGFAGAPAGARRCLWARCSWS